MKTLAYRLTLQRGTSSPSRVKRNRSTFKVPGFRFLPRYRGPRATSPPYHTQRSFKGLCISSLHPKASDEYVEYILSRLFDRFGNVSIQIDWNHAERVAYVYFMSPEAAHEATRLKPHIVFYDKSAMITVAHERREHKHEPRSISPVHERSRCSSVASYYQPPVTERRRAPTVDPYARYPPHPPIHREYRPFPNYLHHVQPEDDPQATRTLFVGNLEMNISEEELRRIFEKYGQLDDIDIKRPSASARTAFAFVRFENLDMAHRAKIELSGQYIGKFQCKIGYGKANPTTRIWVGRLGAWTSLTQLEREFDRFGVIKKIEYKKGDTCAYIWYVSIKAAQAAVNEMRGYALGRPDRRLRIDFSGVPNGQTPKPKSSAPPEPNFVYRELSQYDGYVPRGGVYRGRGRGRGSYSRGGYQRYEPQRVVNEEERRRPLLALEYESTSERVAYSRTQKSQLRVRSPGPHTPSSLPDENMSPAELLGSAATLSDVARKSVTQRSGILILKRSLCPYELYLTDGDPGIATILTKDKNRLPNLRITQRLHMNQSNMNKVQERIRTSKSHAIFLALAGPCSHDQTRPLRILESYLKEKDAAGISPILHKTIRESGLLYAFPPCQFSADLLRRTCHNLTDETLKEDYLVIVLIFGLSAAQL